MHTEDDLREVLHLAADRAPVRAGTVPSNEERSGLVHGAARRRPVWPVLAAAASVAAVLALIVTVLTHNADKAVPAAPTAPLTNEAPKAPYSVTSGVNFRGTVYDGSRTVRLPKELRPVDARVSGGWLAEYYVQTAPSVEPHVGILKTDGTFQRLGPKKALGPILSPDRKQVAMTVYPAAGSPRIAVYDIAGGAEVSSIAAPAGPAGAVRWNPDGIWLDSGDPFSKDRLYLWKPGDATAQRIQVPSGFEAIETSPNSNVVVFMTGAERTKPTPGQNLATTNPEAPQDHCLQVGVLKDNALDVQRDYCSQGQRSLAAILSPDGAKVLNTADKVTIDVATGKTTKLDVPDQLEDQPHPVFEDTTKVLVVSRPDDGHGPQRLYRCEATTGECKLLRTENDNQITLAQP